MAVYTHLSTRDAGWLARRWRLGPVEAFEGIAKGSVNTNYCLVAGARRYFVRLDETRTMRDVHAELRLVFWLAMRGFPTPVPVAGVGGRVTGRLHDKPVMLFPFLPGRDKAAERYSLGDLGQAGALLARLHGAARGFPEVLGNRFGLAATAARWARIRDRARIPASDRREIDDALAAFSREPPPPGPSGIVHGDWFADNLLFEGKSITGVLDFEAAATDALAFDVATAVNALCWKPAMPHRFDARRVSALLDGYSRAGDPSAVTPNALSFWLRASALRFVVTRVQDFRLKRSRLRVEKDYRDFLDRLRIWS